ncbi:two-component response regulator-like APRR2 isoform X1 [Nicotiana tabacum]|uniref:Two-component response regulator-like APRR2 n=2 Tax=Nicotiana TaxID=4085 RepID=A0A1S4ADE0_TOBAC|nr:PREDICTED: two-component response regulator-like APRR2 [Nicotiana sylvestris]XP_009771722.1 PREDICTED: two-component response regulator-like APRR2 [Nicotiana sylvestris]XP_009771723.1 PREDICTED: two-component response regulator-like APRR2 [Nicotiana sylvestris]XP_009771724.1 PREDICTED: two-component response regulator-like APRR2 [Nicotiana sylvestris]XP_009771725.1 PREDICTED: two-component response regulator-like APRR2 [Nicotiana sylvestris]XP_009771726.1 PREDICTED: two-component response r
MVCTENELLGWNDFPKGLRVLLLDKDCNSASEMRSRLEQMNYIVYVFCDENEAFSAISSKSEVFHLAIVEVTAGNNDGGLKFLEIVKDLPTIMVSSIHSISTMMKCIALGAVEFLQKPLSDDKLRNIWQHVVHKAFNSGGKNVSESLKPVKESLLSMLELQPVKSEADNENSNGVLTTVVENQKELPPYCDKYPAPSTPQQKQGVRSVDDGDFQDHTILSTEQDSGVNEGDTKSVETTCCDSVAETTVLADSPGRLGEAITKEEHDFAADQKMEDHIATCSQNNDCPGNSSTHSADSSKASGLHRSSGTKANKKKMKVDWTPELHKKFVKAVEQLGIDQAIPSRILELMKVEGLTRHNVASHLQKFRMQRRQILPKEDEKRWPRPQPRDSVQRSYYPHKAVMAFPTYHSNHAPASGQFYPAWVPPGNYPNGAHMWGSPYYPGWRPSETWHRTPHPGLCADVWGCPVTPPSFGSCPPYPQNASGLHRAAGIQNRYSILEKSLDLQPAEEVIDKVVKEAINKPWLPLPLGLKPPSTESVLDALSKQGISTVPPRITGSLRPH